MTKNNLLNLPSVKPKESPADDPISEQMKKARAFLEAQDFTSIDDLNAKLQEHLKKENIAPVEDFLGLSKEQMYLILNSPFSLKNPIFAFDIKDESALKEIPIIKHALFVLNFIDAQKELKATALGNFPKSIVQALFHEFFSKDRYVSLPHREDDLLEAVRLRHILELSGLIKRRKNKFSLTKDGTLLFKEKKVQELFQKITWTYFNEWNWACGDRYPDFHLIQRSAVFNFYLLHVLAQNWVLDTKLGQSYFNAFPDLERECTHGYFTPEEEITHAFSHRFLAKTCLSFGLLELKEEKIHGQYRELEYFKVTDLFKTSFKFFR